jgi:hypothetical protein
LNPPRARPCRKGPPPNEMTAALACYLNSILEIAETIEAISPDIAAPFREPLLSLRSRLGADPTPEDLAQSRDTVHEILREFSQRARLYNQTLANDLSQNPRPGRPHRGLQRRPQRPICGAPGRFRGSARIRCPLRRCGAPRFGRHRIARIRAIHRTGQPRRFRPSAPKDGRDSAPPARSGIAGYSRSFNRRRHPARPGSRTHRPH